MYAEQDRLQENGRGETTCADLSAGIPTKREKSLMSGGNFLNKAK